MLDGEAFVTCQIVHDDDLARLQCWDEALLDPSCEARAVDGAIKDTWGLQRAYAQSSDKGHRAPMTMRGMSDQALANRAPSPQRSHVCFDPSLIDEDHIARVQTRNNLMPAASAQGDITAFLLQPVECFF